jgi:hypothetical protein
MRFAARFFGAACVMLPSMKHRIDQTNIRPSKLGYILAQKHPLHDSDFAADASSVESQDEAVDQKKHG